MSAPGVMLRDFNFINRQPGVELMMSVLAAVSGFGFKFENDDFITAHGTLRSSDNFGSFHIGFADTGMAFITEDEDLIQFHGFTLDDVKAVYVNNLSRGQPVLFATCFNNRVNVSTLHKIVIIAIMRTQRQAERTTTSFNRNEELFHYTRDEPGT